MGCISSKTARSGSSPVQYRSTAKSSSRNGTRSRSGPARLPSSVVSFGPLEKIKEEPDKEEGFEDHEEGEASAKKRRYGHSGNLKASKKGSAHKNSLFSLKFGRLVEGEQVAAGWPAWLTAVAGEAIDGWLPLRSDNFERLEKIGQGTYSDVYRARNLETRKIVAVKKVRFDNFQPESVRFMSREIRILRRLDHPNIMKLEGIITSRLSSHIYLVFEYMEHDLAGLLSCPDIKFTESQIKCYMKQLLSAVEHCHSRGVLHRDIKTSNVLVNNEGVLKIADFGLANFMRPKHNQPLTSRVVTLWYRPPELLLGSTSYGEAVDLWSVGCVFAELFIGRPLLKGRTEVEQLHKIFKLCGSPPEDYWKTSKLPLANMFKPQHPYESSLRERCKEFPKSAVNLIETFLSIDPYKRGTASAALESKYFYTKPLACDPSSLPKYPPNKEMDAKLREDGRRKRTGAAGHGKAGARVPRRLRKTLQEPSSFFKVVPSEDVEATKVFRKNQRGSANQYKRRSGLVSRTTLKQSYDTVSEASQHTEESQGSNLSTTHSVPVQPSTSTPFLMPKRSQKQQGVFLRLHDQDPTSRSHKNMHANDTSDSDEEEYDGSLGTVRRDEVAKRTVRWKEEKLIAQDLYDSFEPHELYLDGGSKKKNRVAVSGPLTYQSQETASHQRSRFYKDS